MRPARGVNRFTEEMTLTRIPHRSATTLTAAFLVAAVMAGCAGSPTTPEEPGATEDDRPGEPITLTYWSWAPNIEQIVAVWNEANPDVQVAVNTSTGANDIVAKLAAAKQAGDLPDLSNTTYENLPNLIVNEIAADVSDVMAAHEDDTVAAAWALTTFDGVNYAVPQGTSPQMLYYRTDIFAELGLEAPTTWAQYAEAARAIHAADPGSYIATFPTNDGALFASLCQQVGSQWWSVDDGVWSVGIADEACLEVADYWQELVDEGVVATHKTWTPEWQAALADGTLATWMSAVWTPPHLQQNAPDTEGLWAAVALPQWDEGELVSGVYGGSGTIVTTGSKHPEAAKEFAIWLNTSGEALDAYIQYASIWPAAISGRELEGLQQAPEFMSNQPDFYELASEIDERTLATTWGPNVAATWSSFTNEFSEVVSSGGSFRAALEAVDEATRSDLATQGFSVE